MTAENSDSGNELLQRSITLKSFRYQPEILPVLLAFLTAPLGSRTIARAAGESYQRITTTDASLFRAA